MKTTIRWKSPDLIPDEDSKVIILLDSGRIHTGTVRYSMINIHTGEHETDVKIGLGFAPWARVKGWSHRDDVEDDFDSSKVAKPPPIKTVVYNEITVGERDIRIRDLTEEIERLKREQ